MFEWNPFGKVTQAARTAECSTFLETAIASTPVERGHSSDPGRCHEPFRTMVLIAGCLGLRVSEIVPCNGRFDFASCTLLIQRSVVHGQDWGR